MTSERHSLFSRLKDTLSQGGERSALARRQVLLSSLAKIVTIICSLLIVPLTKDYLNPTRYGIWLTLSSIIAWIAYFDFGLGNGFRNRFAEAKAHGDRQLAREYVSTTYFAVSVVSMAALVIVLTINSFLDWTAILRVDPALREELKCVVAILCAFFCLNMTVSLFTTLLTADQRNGVSAWINAIGQVLSLGVIVILTRVSEGSLLRLALYFSGIPCLFVLVASLCAYSLTRYRDYRPSIHNIRIPLVRDILSLGLHFFLISLCLLVIFQMMNIVLSREISPEAVTEYNIAYKYFNVLYAVLLIVITPFWSAFTDAYAQQDFAWMDRVRGSLERVCLLFTLAGCLMLLVAPFIYRIWVGEDVPIAPLTSIAVFLYVVAQMFGNVYMYLINGIGTIRIQLCIYLVMALLAWPLMVWSCRTWGVAGIVVAPTLACLVQALFGRIQLRKIISGTAQGWWIK